MRGKTEKVICGGSNMRAPMKLDFISSLSEERSADWPEIVIARSSREGEPVCFAAEEDAGDIFNCIGIVSEPTEQLISMLRTAPVTARPRALCRKDGTVCTADDPAVWGFIAEYETADKLSAAVREAIAQAVLRGCGSETELNDRAEYMLEQGIPQKIIIRALEHMLAEPAYPELVPCPPVRFVQADAYGELTRGLAYRLSGLNLRLIGGKGCGKNTLAQTLDWLLNIPQYRMQGNAEMDKLDLLGGPTIENGTLHYKLSDMLRYIEAGADVVLDEGNTIKPECADVLHSLTDEARRIQVPGYGLVKMHPKSSFTITMNEGYAGTNYMNEATIDRFTPIQMSEPESVKEILRRVVPTAPEHCLSICDVVYCAIKSRIDSAGGLEPEAMTIRGLVDALRAEPLLGLKWGLLDNVAAKPLDQYTRLQLTELIESVVP